MRKPDIIERVNGVVKEISEWKEYKKAKDAKVVLIDGREVSVFIPPPCKIHVGDYIIVSVMTIKDSKNMFYVYKNHVTNEKTHN